MRRQKASIIVQRPRRSVTLSRLAAWLSFAAAVLSQAALLTGGFLLADDTSPNAMRNAAIAGALGVAGLAVMVLARRAGMAQPSPVALARLPLRLVPKVEPSDDNERRRPAA